MKNHHIEWISSISELEKETGILMHDGSPIGGKYSFDAENRLPWNGEPEPQHELVFETDQIDEEVEKFVNEIFTSHPGK